MRGAILETRPSNFGPPAEAEESLQSRDRATGESTRRRGQTGKLETLFSWVAQARTGADELASQTREAAAGTTITRTRRPRTR